MITIKPVHNDLALMVDFVYPNNLNNKDMEIATEIELVALYQAIDQRYGIEKGSEIITNSIEAYLNAHAI